MPEAETTTHRIFCAGPTCSAGDQPVATLTLKPHAYVGAVRAWCSEACRALWLETEQRGDEAKEAR